MAASMAKSSDVLRDRLTGALLGMFIGDALAMPVHWYYSVDKLKDDYDGGVKGYTDPKFPHRESMVDGMTYKGSIDIIPEDKKQYYNVDSQGPKHSDMHGNQLSNPEDQRMHYHHGLKAGDNTLNMQLVRQVLKLGKEYTPAKYIDNVEAFLTQPQAHNDLYYEIYLRRFFEHKSAGLSGDQSAANQRDIWSIGSHGGLLQAIPMAVLYHNQPQTQATARALEHMQTTHRSLNLMTYGMILVPLLCDLIHGDDVEGAFQAAAAQLHGPAISGAELIGQYNAHKGPGRIPKEDMWRYHTQLQEEPVDFDTILAKVNSGEWSDADVVGQEGLFTSACYPEFGLPAVFYFALKTEFDFERALLDNANAGGDSTGRGAVLGGLLGAALGASSIPHHLLDGLTDKKGLLVEIEAFVEDALLAGNHKF